MALLRLKLARGPAVRELEHRAFVQVVRDAAERAGLPVARDTRGTSGRLRVTPGLPLPPGYVSRCEYMDFELSQPITAWEFRGRLAAELPPGIEVLWQRRLPARAPHLRAAVGVVRYTVADEFDSERAAAFGRADTWPLVRVRKGRERVLDLKQSIGHLAVASGRLTMDIRVRQEGTPKPEEVIESVFGIPREEALLLPTERSAMILKPAPLPRGGMELV